MSFEWRTKKLEDVSINLSNRRVPLSSRERQQLKKVYPYYGAQGVIDYVDSYLFDGEFLLVAEDGENLRSRKQHIANIARGKFWVNNHAHVLLNNDESDLYYLYYYMNSIDISGYLTGSVQPKLSKANLNNISIVCPPIDEQKGISKILRVLDEKIELNNAINKNLEEMAQALFKRWFIDFEFPNENGEPYKSSGGEFEESELGMIPKGWKLTQLEELIDINPKRVLKKGECKPYVEMKNIQNNYARVSKYVMREYNSGSKFSNGDVLFARITPCLENGKTAYVDFLKGNEVGWGSTEFLVLRSRPGIPSEFTYFLARSDQFRSHAILSMTGSSGRQRVPESSLRNYRVPLPVTPDLILAFGEVVKSTLNLMKRNDDESNRLIQIRDTLLPKLMSGEIRVPVDQESPQATTRQIVAEENESYNAT
ncbi:restriction endonuclease subunit S [Brevibacillus agri]|uniref:restriction endonuclease subunit S n=1 Tax=Brevibacillus agri TaxID=51101 RepID=UPI003D1EE8E2